MEIIPGLLASLCFIVGCVALIGLLVPIRRLGLKTRKRALGILVLSFIAFVIAGAIAPESDQEIPESPERTQTEETPIDEQPDDNIAPETPHIETDDSRLTEAPSKPQLESGNTPGPQIPAQSEEKLLATWESNLGAGITIEESLIHRDGMMVLERRFSDGSTGSWELIERPAEHSGERKFDLEDDIRSEYFTLSDAGVVKYFGWEGNQFATALATLAAPSAMTVGSNVQIRHCVPEQLSETAVEVVRLYEQLHDFKDDSEFARLGFAIGGPYNTWLQSIDSLQDSTEGPAALEVLNELGFFVGDIWELGMAYMSLATSAQRVDQDDLNYIEGMERTIQAGLALAFCKYRFQFCNLISMS